MRVLKFMYQAGYPYRLYFFGIILAITFVSIDTNVKPYLLKLLIDATTDPQAHHVITLAILYGVFQLLNTGAWALCDWCVIHFAGHFRENIITSFIDRISLYSHSFFQNHLAGSLTAKINDTFSLVPSIVFTITHQFIQFTLTVFIALFFLGKVHMLFALSLVVWIMVFLTLSWVWLRQAIPLTKQYAESKSQIGGQVGDMFANMLNVKCFAALPFERSRLNMFTKRFIEQGKAQGFCLMNFYLLQGIFITFYIMGFLTFLLYLQAENRVTAGDFVLVFMLNFHVAEKLYDLSHQLREFLPNWGTIDQALALLDQPPEIQDKYPAKALVVTKGEIVFDQVHFRYKDTEPLFQDKSLIISGGQKVGLVGSSGGGK